MLCGSHEVWQASVSGVFDSNDVAFGYRCKEEHVLNMNCMDLGYRIWSSSLYNYHKRDVIVGAHVGACRQRARL